MHSRLTIAGISIPAYGAMILLGILITTFSGIIICQYRKLQIKQFLWLELFGGISALAGAKFWYMVVNSNQSISFDTFLGSGYSSYGGIMAGMIGVYVSAKCFRIDIKLYVRYLIFLVPLFHAFWKLGCYMGGCCYGIEYGGIGSVVFPEGVPAPAGVPLFPVQLLEMVVLLILSIVFFIKSITGLKRPILEYIGCYSVLRFMTEFLRQNKSGNILSTAQWVSVICLLSVVIILKVENVLIKDEKGENGYGS